MQKLRGFLVGLAAAVITACSSDVEPEITVAVDNAPVHGLVLTDFRFVLPGAGPNDCPNGFNLSLRNQFLSGLEPAEQAKYANNEELLREAIGPFYYDDPSKDPCANPQAFDDPGMYTIETPLAIKRLEADGSLSQRSLPPGRCPSSDAFYANVDENTLDNQYWRVMGCVRSFQPGGLADAFAGNAIIEGNATVLIEVKGPKDGANGDVEVHIYSSPDPVPLGTTGAVLPNGSFAIGEQTRFHNSARGRIENGVLTTAPFDLRLVRKAQRLDSELYLRNARLRLELQPDGGAKGYLGGYWDLEWLAHSSIRIQDKTGRSSGNAAADAHGYTCPGKYYAVKRLADGHPDPETGECTSISTLYRLEAVPAFVLHSPAGRHQGPAPRGLDPDV